MTIATLPCFGFSVTTADDLVAGLSGLGPHPRRTDHRHGHHAHGDTDHLQFRRRALTHGDRTHNRGLHDTDTKDDEAMSAQTLDDAEDTTTQTSTSYTTASTTQRKTADATGQARGRRSWATAITGRFTRTQDAAGQRRLPTPFWGLFYRGLVVVGDWMLVLSTAFVAIPLLGAWMHQQSGAAQGQLTGAGTIAMWLVPFAFIVTVLTAAEIALMKHLWRWAGRRVAATKADRNLVAEAQDPGPSRSPRRPRTGPPAPPRRSRTARGASDAYRRTADERRVGTPCPA